MKRKSHPSDSEDSEPTTTRKRFAKAPPAKESLPCKFKLLRQWALTEEVSHYLTVKNGIKE